MVDTPSQNGGSEHEDARQELRQRLRYARKSLTAQALQQAAANLQPNVMAVLDSVQQTTPLNRVAGYLAFQGEIDVCPVMDALRVNGIETYVPMLNGETLQFALWSPNTPRTTNRFGIVEPSTPKTEWLDASAMDAVLAPLVAFDERKHRMGMGGGFYDKTFANRRRSSPPPWLIGVAHQLQQVPTVHSDWWDVPLDHIVTDEKSFT